MPKEPSYEDLLRQRQEEWAQAQKIAQGRLEALQAQIRAMPDVRDAPAVGHPWTHPDVKCDDCGKTEFVMRRWVTVNGARYRTEVDCLACGLKQTWDWAEARWLR